MRGNHRTDVFFPGLRVQLNLWFPLQADESIISFKMNPEAGVCLLLSVVRRLKLITGHTGEPAPASQLDSVNEGGAYLLFSLTAHLQGTDAVDAGVARGGGGPCGLATFRCL